MCSYKILLLSSAAALVSSAALAAEFNGRDIPSHAAAIVGFHRIAPGTQHSPVGHPKTAKCGTQFGAKLPTPDGIISWNDTTGTQYDTGGAADFTCASRTKIKQVWVTGWDLGTGGGLHTDQFNITFYQNDPAGGSDEPNDSQVVCAYTGLPGDAGVNDYDSVLTKLRLSKPCKFKAGKKYWVEVQNNNSAGPWYWEATSQLSGTQADWVDRNNMFGDGCATLNNNRYLVDCLGYTYPDYMIELH